MRVSKRILIANVGVLVGCFAGLYLAPPSTPRWILVLACFGAVTLLNVVMFLASRIRKTTGIPTKRNSFQSTVIWIILAVLIVVQILVRLGYLSY